jgi:hypothetical protein
MPGVPLNEELLPEILVLRARSDTSTESPGREQLG